MSRLSISHGCNLLQALRAARELGCIVVDVNRTGEVRVSHHLFSDSVRVDRRRKDAPRQLTRFLQRVVRASLAPAA
jgi:hypothetical protein